MKKGDEGQEREKEEIRKASQAIPRLNDIRELRRYFTKGYLGIIPRNYKQLIEYSEKHTASFMSYEGGVFVKGWEGVDEVIELVDLLLSFSKIKKFRFNCIREDAAELVGKAVQFYEELVELELNGCQLNDRMTEDILESIVAPEKLRLLDVSNNNLSEEMFTNLQVRFPNVRVKFDFGGSLVSSSQPSVEGPLSKLTVPSLLREKKGEEKEKGTEGTYRKPTSTNDLPSISFNYRELLEVLDEIEMDSLEKEKKAIPYLKNVEQKVNEIKRYQLKQYPENFYESMKADILEIRNTARSLYELTEPQNLTLSNKLTRLILKSITPFERKLSKRLEMTIEEEEVLKLKIKRLYAEQSYVARKKKSSEKLKKHLDELNQLLTQTGKPSPYCYISYAWPSKENKQEEYWVQPFLSILYDHLTAGGIRVIMDIRDNKPGDSIYEFMRQYEYGNHIILVGTESLLEKHYSITPHAVKTELSIINNRFEEDIKVFGKSRIYPLLISGTNKTSFPGIYDKYRTVRDAIEPGYLLMMKKLLDWIYDQRINKKVEKGIKINKKIDYEKLWHDLDKNCPGLSKDVDVQKIERELDKRYHWQQLGYLRQDYTFRVVEEAQKKAKHNPTVEAKRVDDLIVVQGLNPKFQAIKKARKKAKHSPIVEARKVGNLMVDQGFNPRHLYTAYGQRFSFPCSSIISMSDDFIGRQGLWDEIVYYFTKSDQPIRTLNVHGLGGIGKTELAKYYYLYPPRPYALRVWFSAEDKELLYLHYVDLANKFNSIEENRVNRIEFEKETTIQEQARQVKNWLDKQNGCLLVYDNVPGVKQLEGLLPKRGEHHILITSRNAVEWPVHQSIDVDVMKEHEAIALICKITGCQEKTVGLKELVSILDYLPLALAQAGAYIAEKQTSIRDYLRRYQEYQSHVMNDSTLSRNPKHELVWVTFDRNFEVLGIVCPCALTILKQVSWLNASAIPEIILETILKNTKGTEDKPLGLLWDDIKKHVSHYSLMRVDREGHQLSMHRLLQDVLRGKQDEMESKKILKQVALSIECIYLESDKPMKNLALAKLLLPHMEAVSFNLKKFFNESEYNDFKLEFYLRSARDRIENTCQN